MKDIKECKLCLINNHESLSRFLSLFLHILHHVMFLRISTWKRTYLLNSIIRKFTTDENSFVKITNRFNLQWILIFIRHYILMFLKQINDINEVLLSQLFFLLNINLWCKYAYLYHYFRIKFVKFFEHAEIKSFILFINIVQ